ncbi:MAG: hypothetical protein QOG27_248 [Verrucomicrobiota bacterium]
MSLRIACVIIGASCFALAGVARAETVSFPKENPAFTIEVPKDAEVKYESDRLAIRIFKHGKITFSTLPDKVHDDSSARASLASTLDTYMKNFYAGDWRPTAPEVPKERGPVGPKAHGFSVEGSAGNRVRLEVEDMELQSQHYLAAVFTLDDKKYFDLWSEYDLTDEALFKKKSRLVDFQSERRRIIDSIKSVK